jgi:hypothetical protein
MSNNNTDLYTFSGVLSDTHKSEVIRAKYRTFVWCGIIFLIFCGIIIESIDSYYERLVEADEIQKCVSAGFQWKLEPPVQIDHTIVSGKYDCVTK